MKRCSLRITKFRILFFLLQKFLHTHLRSSKLELVLMDTHLNCANSNWPYAEHNIGNPYLRHHCKACVKKHDQVIEIMIQKKEKSIISKQFSKWWRLINNLHTLFRTWFVSSNNYQHHSNKRCFAKKCPSSVCVKSIQTLYNTL